MPGTEDNISDFIQSSTGDTFGQNEPPLETDADEGVGFDQSADDQVTQQLQRRDDPSMRRDQPPKQPNEEKDASDPNQKKDAKGSKDRKSVRPNKDGDLVDERGNVIASRGEARRLAGQVNRLRTTNQELTERLQAQARQLADNQYLGGIPAKYGIDNDQVAQALEIAAAYKQNPASAVRAFLQIALKDGVELQDIMADAPNLGVRAIKNLLDERLKPLEQERQQGVDVEQRQREGAAQANQFLGDYPDMELHTEVLADQMNKLTEEYQARGIPIPSGYVLAERARDRIIQFCSKNGLDVDQPLRDQILARQNAQPSNGGHPTTNRNNGSGRETSRRPMPNGSRGGEVIERRTKPANADESYRSIIRESMSEAGIPMDH